MNQTIPAVLLFLALTNLGFSQSPKQDLETGQKRTEQGYAMGFLIDNKNGLKVFNDGGQAGTRTYLFVLPKEKFAVACITNLQNAFCAELLPKIGQALSEK